MTRVDPSYWQFPNWHPDWDGEFVFAGLRTLAKAVLGGTDLDVKLTVIEDRYAHVDVFCGATRIGLVYVNRADDPAVPQFTVHAGAKEDELTTTDTAAAVRFLDLRRTAFPDDAG